MTLTETVADAELHLAWKGSDGKTYTKVSRKAHFTVKCGLPVTDGVAAG